MRVLLTDKCDRSYVLVEAAEVFCVTSERFTCFIESILVNTVQGAYDDFICEEVGHLTVSDWNIMLQEATKSGFLDLTNWCFVENKDDDDTDA